MRVLLVEDEMVIALFYMRALTASGFTVRLAHSGEDALAQVDADPSLDLLVMDINLPGELDGIETCARIRQMHDIPALYVTAYSDPETRARAERTGPLGFLIKPVDAEELCREILRCCRGGCTGCRDDH